ncbi:MAG: TolB family protein [Steroidobacteraceae bacterium]
MPYRRIERRLAALLDSAPGLRAFAKAGYQRVNYLLHGWRGQAIRLHPQATIERIAGGPDECFFGYFGLQPWSRDGSLYLFNRWRPPLGQTVDVCVHDRRGESLRTLGESRAWNFQQGCMAQWLYLDGVESVAFNDAVDRRLACRIVTLTGRERILEWPIQALHPRGTEALSLNYRRLARIRPEYGYDVAVDNFAPDQPVERDGIWRVDLRSGDSKLIVSLQQLVETAPRADMADADHKVNHAVYSPSGGRFVFMHRWLGSRGKYSRLYCASSNGTGLRILLDHRMVSHYAWRDENTLLVWARAADGGDGYYLLDASTGAGEALYAGTLDRYGDGHPSFSPDGRWIVTDTYPDRGRMRRLLLCRFSTGQVIEVGAFHSPWRYDGPVRCDLHPRWSAHGPWISIDSAHEGFRGTYVVDVSRLLRGSRSDTTAP